MADERVEYVLPKIPVSVGAPIKDRRGRLLVLKPTNSLSDAALRAVVLQAEEIAAHRLEPVPQALGLLRAPIRRLVSAALAAPEAVYLENGRPVPRKSVQDRPPGRDIA